VISLARRDDDERPAHANAVELRHCDVEHGDIGLDAVSWFTDQSPVRSDAATIMSGSDPTQREISP